MADVNWTKEQKDAITATDGTVLVCAAAGSGKTAVLVERVIEILVDEKNPCAVDEMLIVTFTNAAASQMKEKISKKLNGLLKENPKNSFLQRQKMLLSNANISTIDSFCNDILKSNYHKTGIAQSSRLIDENEMKCLMTDTFEEIIDEYYEKDDEIFKELVDAFSSSGNDDNFRDLVFKLYKYSCAYPFPEKWINQISENFLNKSLIYRKVVAEYLEKAFEYFYASCKKLLELIEDDEEVSNTYGQTISVDKLFLEKVSEMSRGAGEDDEKWDALMQTVLSYNFEKMKSKPSGSTNELFQTVKPVRDNYVKWFKEKADGYFFSDSIQDREDIEKMYPLMKSLSDFLLDFSRLLDEKKIEKNVFTFSDTLHTAIKLLVNEDLSKTDVAKQYSEKFKYILVDEYQDTNYAQDILFEAVAHDSKDNLFFVGDVKQSIYGFRQAMPQLFIDRRNSYSLYQNNNYPANIFLGKNFRSREGVTKFVNFLFEQIMSNDAGGIDYNENEKLVYGASYRQKQESDVEIDYINSEEDERKSAELEAAFVAKRIEEILSSGMLIKDGDEERPIEKRDICILLHSPKTDAPIFAGALREREIDCLVENKDSLFDTTEIRILLSFMKVINNPLDDIAALSVMMSPIFSFSADDVAKLRTDGDKGASIYNCVVKKANSGDEKCCNFLKTVSKYRLVGACIDVNELVGKLIEETGFDSMVLAMKDGEKRRSNLYLFKDYVKTISSNSNTSLSSLIRLIGKMRENNTGVEQSPVFMAGKDAVNILSIHKSKGLEFPVCILALCSKEFNLKDTYEPVIVNSSLGVGIERRDKDRFARYETINHLALKTQTKKEKIEEEMRVLYVALTRAKEKLIICMNGKKANAVSKSKLLSLSQEKVPCFEVLNAKCYGDWILPAVCKHIGMEKMRKDFSLSDVFIKSSDFSIDFNMIDEVEREIVLQTAEEKVSVEESIVKEINEKIDYEYKYNVLKGISSKRGASDGKNKLNREFFASSRPAFLNKEGLSPAQKGTAMHLFMQHADYFSAKENLEKEIENVKNNGFLNEPESLSLDRKKLFGFFNSSLAKRMFSSSEIMREKKFIFNMSPNELQSDLPELAWQEKIVVQGIIDCAFYEDDEIVVVDYKTDKVSSADELRQRYCDQLAIYTKAVEECFGRKVKDTVIYSFFLGEEISVK